MRIRNSLTTRGGFIRIIVVIVLALVILKFVFNVDVKDILESRFIADLISVTKAIFKLIWDAVLIALELLKMIISKANEFIKSLKF
ncbi:MAG: hypothetical protein QG585_522 [Patescibacteria group bacterium]|jgi:hypothetical protein|nr:hypothetical protein [Patescibacteria group bacterium]